MSSTSSTSSFFFTVPPLCGDRILSSGEQCDDGNTVSGDGCSSVCQTERTFVAGINICGDGIALSPEQCDDGNRRNFDGCNSTCTIEFSFSVSSFSRGTIIPGGTSSLPPSFLRIPEGLPEQLISLQFQDERGTPQTLQVPLQQLLSRIQTQVAGESLTPSGEISTLSLPFQYQDEQGQIQTIDLPMNQLLAQIIPFFPLPTTANLQPLPYPVILPRSKETPVGDTGPVALVILAMGMAAGVGIARRRKR